MTKINIGIIGSGFNGQIAFIENLYKNKKCKINGLAEARPILRKKVAKKYKIPNSYSSHLDLIQDIKKFDGIVVVTKRNMIGPVSLEFLKLGKPVLTEKPMAGTYKQSLKLLNTAKKFKTLYKIGYNKIYDDGILKAKLFFDKLIKNKNFGKIVLIRSHRLSGSGYDSKNKHITTKEKNFLSNPSWTIKPNWLPQKLQKSYDKYLNLYCHNISLLRYFTNEIPKVENASLSDFTMSIVNLKYKKFNATLETGFFTKKGWDETLEIYFEYGSIIITLPPQHHKKITASFVVHNTKKDKKYNFKSQKTWAFKNQTDSFIEDIIKNKIKINKAEDGVKDIKLIEDIWKNYLKK